jgi:hypothetical protein
VLVACAAAAVSALGAAASLALPAMSARVVGLRSGGATLDLRFTLLGVETVGSWLLIALALGVAAAGLRALRAMPQPGELGRGRLLTIVASLAAATAAWPFVQATPLRTLTSFVPPEVQADFGSEFASIAFSSLPQPLSVASLSGTALALGVLLICIARASHQPVASASELEGEPS